MPPYVYLRNGLAVEKPTLEQPAWKFPRYVRKGVRAEGFVMEDALDHLLGQAVGYVKDRATKEKPFFLYFPMPAPHKPVFPHKRFRGKTDLADYGDFVVQVDWTVGTVARCARPRRRRRQHTRRLYKRQRLVHASL